MLLSFGFDRDPAIAIASLFRISSFSSRFYNHRASQMSDVLAAEAAAAKA
jgi:hypothetical protein